MTQDNSELNRLEEILETLERTAEDYETFFKAFATEPLTVAVSPAWQEPDQAPPAGSKLLFVSDGSNLEQPMLAVFTRPARAEAFCSEHSADSGFVPYETTSAWVLLQVPENTGVMLNPNAPRNFRISPELAADLKQDVIEALGRSRGAREAT